MTGGARQADLAQVDLYEIRGLVKTIVDVYGSVLAADLLKHAGTKDPNKSQKKIIKILAAMAAQTIECSYFIRDYAVKKSPCMPFLYVTSARSDCHLH